MRSGIYTGWIQHRRVAPKPHDFRYGLFMLYLDLDEIDEVLALTPLWSRSRFAPARFTRSDYFGDPQRDLGECVRDHVEEQLGWRPRGPIRLLTHLRYFGYIFNPASFYYCFGEDGTRPEAILVEVTNTPWNQRHAYTLDARSAMKVGDSMRFDLAKAFHVSPFLDMNLEYQWRFSLPGQELLVHMENYEEGHRIFDAVLSVQRSEISARNLNGLLLRYPLMTLKVILGIHLQAARLRWKGVPFFPHPDKRKAASNGENP